MAKFNAQQADEAFYNAEILHGDGKRDITFTLNGNGYVLDITYANVAISAPPREVRAYFLNHLISNVEYL